MKVLIIALASIVLTSLTACVDQGQFGPLGTGRQAVIEGKERPGDLGFSLHLLQENAVLAQIGGGLSKALLGCTTTLVGDRVVVSAGHCVVGNGGKWLAGEEEPAVQRPDEIKFVVGRDADQPLCTLQVESIHLHPAIQPSEIYGIEHDLSVLILKASVLESCPDVAPISINRHKLDPWIKGEQLLQGGFGSLDGTHNYSPLRHWSMVEVFDLDQNSLVVKDIEQGFPTFGDSGSAVLHRSSDGILRHLGALYGGTDVSKKFTRLDTHGEFIRSVVNEQLLCGPAAGEGTCVGDVHISCDGGDFTLEDCQEQDLGCGPNDQGAAGCTCTCDKQPFCEEGCACDPDCACVCDLSAGCDQGCACDAACQVVSGLDSGVTESDAAVVGPEEEAPGGCALVSAPLRPGRLPLLFFLFTAFVLLGRRVGRSRRKRSWRCSCWR